MSCMKAIGFVDCSADEAFARICDFEHRSDLDPNYTSVVPIEVIDEHHLVVYNTFAGFFGIISPRDFVCALYKGSTPDGDLLLAAVSCTHPSRPPQHGFVRGENFPSSAFISVGGILMGACAVGGLSILSAQSAVR